MQSSFTDLEYAAKKKLTQRGRFLAEIDMDALAAELEPFYPKCKGRGRPPIGLERRLRMYVAQQYFWLSDEDIEDAIYDSQSIRSFVGIDLGREDAPYATTLLKFRPLFEAHELTRKILETINRQLSEKGLLMRKGTIVDATLIAAQPSTKNRDKARDPDMHQTNKGNQWLFGMKAHISVDAYSDFVHTLLATLANVADVTETHALLHGEETIAFDYVGYQGLEKREEGCDSDVDRQVSMKRDECKALPDDGYGRALENFEKAKASLWAKVKEPLIYSTKPGHSVSPRRLR